MKFGCDQIAGYICGVYIGFYFATITTTTTIEGLFGSCALHQQTTTTILSNSNDCSFPKNRPARLLLADLWLYKQYYTYLNLQV